MANGACRPGGLHVRLVSLAIVDTKTIVDEAYHPGGAYKEKLNIFKEGRFFTLNVGPHELHDQKNDESDNTGKPQWGVCHLLIDKRKQKA